MSDPLYSAADVIDKTLIATRDLPVFDGYPTKTYTPQQIGIVKAGNSAGIVYSWISADPANNRSVLYWMFWPAVTGTDKYYFMAHHAGDFDVSALRQQGVISVSEKIEQEKKRESDENKEWYEKVMDRVIPIGAGVILVGAVIKGLLTRTKTQS